MVPYNDLTFPEQDNPNKIMNYIQIYLNISCTQYKVFVLAQQYFL